MIKGSENQFRPGKPYKIPGYVDRSRCRKEEKEAEEKRKAQVAAEQPPAGKPARLFSPDLVRRLYLNKYKEGAKRKRHG